MLADRVSDEIPAGSRASVNTGVCHTGVGTSKGNSSFQEDNVNHAV
jgi:hypothetical protein